MYRYNRKVYEEYCMGFTVNAPYKPTGDQPKAIEQLVRGVHDGLRYQTLLGATGTGKTAVMSCSANSNDRRWCWPTTKPW